MARRPEGITEPRKGAARRRIGVEDETDQPGLNSGTGAPVDAPYVLTQHHPLLPNERRLNCIAPIFKGDHGPKQDVDVGIFSMGPSGPGHTAGAVPDAGPIAGTTRFLCEDATFKVPPGGASGGPTLKGQEFLATGTFVVPDGVTSLWLTMIGGGGGGSTSITAGTSGGGGGAGEAVTMLPVIAIAGASYPVTIGIGGPGGTPGQVAAQTGGNGGDTSFAGWLARGGKAPPVATNASSGAGGGSGGAASASVVTSGTFGVIEASTHFGGSSGGGGSNSTVTPGAPGGGAGSNAGGLGGAAFSAQAGGGGGASTVYGSGGTGGAGGSSGLVPPAGAYGAGGGGSGGKATTTAGGGSGLSGYCLVQWIS